MKTQRRHELETNTLARELGRWIDRARPFTRSVVGVLVAACVVVAVAALLRRQSTTTETAAWNAYFQATEGGRPQLDELLSLTTSYQGTSVEPWAELAWADAQLQIGSRILFRDKAEGQRRLNEAIDEYRKLIQSDTHEIVRQRGLFGLARAHECLGQIDEARNRYREVTGPLAEAARQRVGLLEQQSSEQFYDWFAEAKLPSNVSPQDPGVPGAKPDFSLEGLEGLLPESEPSSQPPAPDASLPQADLPGAAEPQPAPTPGAHDETGSER
jgi:hypothetical protein